MSTWLKAILAGMIVATIVFLVYGKLMPLSKKEGLHDVHYWLKATNETLPGESPAKDILGETPSIIKQRITDLGYTSFIRTQRNNNLDILVNNVSDTLLVRQTITRNNRIEFRELYTLDELPNLFTIADKVADKFFSGKGASPGIYSIISPLVSDDATGITKFPAALGAVDKNDTALLSRILQHVSVLQILPADLQFRYGVLTDEGKIRSRPNDLYLYALRTHGEKAGLQNMDIEQAVVYQNSDDGNPDIIFKFNTTGSVKWAAMTSKNIGRYLVIILDGIVITAMAVYSPVTGGITSLHTLFSPVEANNLAKQLKTGMLPADLVITRSEISGEPVAGIYKKLFIVLIAFLVTATAAFFILNTLKNS
jgi:preprotein translocase subunit SecD